MTSLLKPAGLRPLMSHKMGPTVVLFVSTNIANLANLIFNMVFARLMGPEAFADLTFLLTLKLGVLCILSAFQLAFSQYTAKSWFGKDRVVKRAQTERFAARLVTQSLWVSVPIMLFALIFAEGFARAFQFSDVKSLLVLLTVIPILFPMIVYRGLAQGRIDLPRIISSLQGEWIIRLFGAVAAWYLGLGLTGIALAVVLSILIAAVLSMTPGDVRTFKSDDRTQSVVAPKLLWATAPFIALQMAQVLILDGDILLVKATQTAEFSGYVAGLMLIQRVFFFAFLSFSALLLPVISAKIEKSKTVDRPLDGKINAGGQKCQGRSDLRLMMTGVAALSLPAILILMIVPSLGIKLLLGSGFGPVTHLTALAGATGAVFTITHLSAVYWLANGRSGLSLWVLGLALVQVVLLSLISAVLPNLSVSLFFGIKLMLQILICLGLLTYTFLPRRTEMRV